MANKYLTVAVIAAMTAFSCLSSAATLRGKVKRVTVTDSVLTVIVNDGVEELSCILIAANQAAVFDDVEGLTSVALAARARGNNVTMTCGGPSDVELTNITSDLTF